jgi:acyl-[acyl-carrier-protein] desaturase
VETLVPDRAALDRVLEEYLTRARSSGWSPYDLVDKPELVALARPDRISPEQLSAVRTVLYVEDHLPGYLSEHLRLFTDTSLPDERQFINRTILRFSFNWAAEEDRHSHVLEMYLVNTGLMSREQLDADLMRERNKAFRFPYSEPVDTFIYLALQEHATLLYYQALSSAVEDPVLRNILKKMASDEARHRTFFFELITRGCSSDLDAIDKFDMPIQRSLDNYRRQVVTLMRAAPRYRQADVFDQMNNLLNRARRKHQESIAALVVPSESPLVHL